jgi:FixJ family two-component response regulator
VADNPALDRLRQLVARRKQLTTEIDEVTETVLRDGAFVSDIAEALGESRETVRRFRKDHGIPDAREIRRIMGGPARRS